MSADVVRVYCAGPDCRAANVTVNPTPEDLAHPGHAAGWVHVGATSYCGTCAPIFVPMSEPDALDDERPLSANPIVVMMANGDGHVAGPIYLEPSDLADTVTAALRQNRMLSLTCANGDMVFLNPAQVASVARRSTLEASSLFPMVAAELVAHVDAAVPAWPWSNHRVDWNNHRVDLSGTSAPPGQT